MAAGVRPLVLNGETVISRVRQRQPTPPRPPPPPSSTTSSSSFSTPPPPNGDNFAVKVSPPHGAIEFGAADGDGESVPTPRPVYVRPILPVYGAAASFSSPTTNGRGRDLSSKEEFG